MLNFNNVLVNILKSYGLEIKSGSFSTFYLIQFSHSFFFIQRKTLLEAIPIQEEKAKPSAISTGGGSNLLGEWEDTKQPVSTQKASATPSTGIDLMSELFGPSPSSTPKPNGKFYKVFFFYFHLF